MWLQVSDAGRATLNATHVGCPVGAHAYGDYRVWVSVDGQAYFPLDEVAAPALSFTGCEPGFFAGPACASVAECDAQSPGAYTDECQPCPRGMYQNEAATYKCRVAGPETYTDATGATSPLACPASSEIRQEIRRVSRANCACKRGYFGLEAEAYALGATAKRGQACLACDEACELGTRSCAYCPGDVHLPRPKPGHWVLQLPNWQNSSDGEADSFLRPSIRPCNENTDCHPANRSLCRCQVSKQLSK